MIKYLLLATLLLSGCTKTDSTRQLLAEQGYTNIKIKGYAPLSCSDDDTFKTKFIATNSNGKVVKGVVCSGVLKGSTIRFD